MDTQMLKSLELLDKFLKETPKEELDAMFEEFDNMDFEGPTVSEYFETFAAEFYPYTKPEST